MKTERGMEPQSSYYSVLGVSEESSFEEIRRAYRQLALQWHPDRWTKTPSLLGEAKARFQQIQEAYSVLSDERRRTLYDAGLYDPEEGEEEGFADFVQEMLSLMADTRREETNCSMEELQTMLVEMAQGFEPSSWLFRESPIVDDSGCSEMAQWNMPSIGYRDPRLSASPGWQFNGGASGFCR